MYLRSILLNTTFLTLTMSGAVYATDAVRSEQLIFPIQDKHVHGSSVVECPNGDLLTCWYHGSGERSANDVVIQGARLKKGATQWSPPFVMADTPQLPDCNPVLFIDRHQKLWLFWVAVRANRWQHSVLKYRTATEYSADGAPQWTWQDIILLEPGDQFAESAEKGFKELNVNDGLWSEYAPSFRKLVIEAAKDPVKRQEGWMTRIHPIQLPSGRILLPLYSDGFELSLVGISDDDGHTWTASRPIVGLGNSQPSLVRRKDGSILAWHRDNGEAPKRVQLSQSADNGETWSVARDTDVPNPGASVEVIALSDGRWAMIFNDTEQGRHSLALAISEDEGVTWKHKRPVEVAEIQGGNFSYPSLIQSRDGVLHVTYSWSIPKQGKSIKHVAVTPEWVTQTESVTAGK